MLVESNIPLYKVYHPSFQNFILKYFGQPAPNHSTLQRTYLKKIYDLTIRRIRQSIGDSRIWISIDETTDAKGQFVVNAIVGCLNPERPSSTFLLNSEVVQRTNHVTIAQAFCNS